jgi:hypothetical protein
MRSCCVSVRSFWLSVRSCWLSARSLSTSSCFAIPSTVRVRSASWPATLAMSSRAVIAAGFYAAGVKPIHARQFEFGQRSKMASLALCARTPAEAQTTSTRVARETRDLGEQSSTCRASFPCTGVATRRAERLTLGSRMVSSKQRFPPRHGVLRARSASAPVTADTLAITTQAGTRLSCGSRRACRRV